ncbi:MAG: Gfo/Idh/MocA family oxidoreductase [Treponema sp.]|nr:Gfo/Idh/MocA family oxidoreductase [Treponema sp.]
MQTIVKLPLATKKRLIQLLQILRAWQSEKITSLDISNSTGWKDTLIRHDLWLIGFNKGVKNGYFKNQMISFIEKSLGIESKPEFTNHLENNHLAKNCCIVGLGRLGEALLDDSMLEKSPFEIKAGFDSNLNRVEILRSRFPLYPATEIQYTVKSEKIDYAILTVPDKDAQLMTDRLVKAGIKGIVNMTGVILKVPQNVKVENISILNALNMVI